MADVDIDESQAPIIVTNDNVIEMPDLELDTTLTDETDAGTLTSHTPIGNTAQPNFLVEINVEQTPTPSTSASDTPTPTQTSTPTTTPTPSSTSAIHSTASSSSETEYETPGSATLSAASKHAICEKVKSMLQAHNVTKVGPTGTTIFSNEFIMELRPMISMDSPSQLSANEPNANTKNKVKVKKMALKNCLRTMGLGIEANVPARAPLTTDNVVLRTNSGFSSSRSLKKHTKKDPLVATATSAKSARLGSSKPSLRRKCTPDNNGNSTMVARDSEINDQSNVFLYIDLHGHASKKGIFMYGNYLQNTAEAVECMLLPRLMSMNCLHFHYDACVFSERNMYHKGKRDGLSKEGSGRVSVYKAIGLLRCYTLEGNYNMGKCVNVLPPLPKEAKKIPSSAAIPPKFTPFVFEEVCNILWTIPFASNLQHKFNSDLHLRLDEHWDHPFWI